MEYVSNRTKKVPTKQLKIMILGGGTAGWMAANLMAKRWQNKSIDIVLVESADIGIVGVGEGSTPQLKLFFDYLDIDESEWMPRCNATYKNGISFKNWSTKPGFSEYFHPFPSAIDNHSAQGFLINCHLRRQGFDVDAHPDRFFLAAELAKKKLGPVANYNFPFEVSYGYHFDAGLLGQLLKEKALLLGVEHISCTINETQLTETGDIKNLVSEDGMILEADFFIDCSGFRSVLMQQKLEVPFVSFADNLFNNAAVTLASPVNKQLNSKTISTALHNGWAWDIPLTNRTGNGYVYSDLFCSADEAETELRTKTGLLDADVEARHLKMKVGRIEKHWHKNCLAIGLSQGFIEPLEATALHLVQDSIQNFITLFERGGFSNEHQQQFNQLVNDRFEGIRDYIVAHYRVNSRDDSDYWIANGENSKISQNLVDILNCWIKGSDLGKEIERLQMAKFYPVISWYCLLAGNGVFPDKNKLKPLNISSQKVDLHQIDEFIKRCSLNFTSQSENLHFEKKEIKTI